MNRIPRCAIIAFSIGWTCLVAPFVLVSFALVSFALAPSALGDVTVTTDAETGWQVYTLRQDTTQIRLVPAAGCNVSSLQVDGVEFFRTPPRVKDTPGVRYGNPILYPTPNRIRDGVFRYGGKEYRFKPAGKGNHIHGLVNRAAWSMVSLSSTAQHVELTCELTFSESDKNELYRLFPFRHRLLMRIRVQDKRVRWTYIVDNTSGKTAVPFGIGFHPYFVYLNERAETYLTVPAKAAMEAPELLPTGKLLSLAGHPLDARKPRSLANYSADDVFIGMQPETPAVVEFRTARQRITFRSSADFTHLVVYTPQKPFFCVENQTCSTDAHNLAADDKQEVAHLQECPAGKQLSGWVEYVIETP